MLPRVRRHHPAIAGLRPWRCAISASLLLITACGAPHAPNRTQLVDSTRNQNIVVVLLDAAVATHFSFLGYDRETTPNLRRLAEESVVFENAYAQASATPLSVLSIFTSRYPLLERTPELMGEIGPVLPANVPSLGRLMSRRYEHRVGVSANSWISGDFGYGGGFTDFLEVFGERGSDQRLGTAKRVSDTMCAWLDRHDVGPFFAYVHYYEPHAPYTPPAPYDRRFDPEAHGHVDGGKHSLKPLRRSRPDDLVARNVTALYDGNLAYADAQVQRIVEALQQSEEWNDTVFVLVSDHGEAFWEHGVRGHGLHAYEEFIHVPLLIRVPGLVRWPRRVATPVELVDLLPTLLELADVPAEGAGLMGRSLVPLLLGDAGSPYQRPVFSRNHDSGSVELGMRKGKWKMVQRVALRRIELYDLQADPQEQRNLFREEDEGSPTWQTAREMAIELQDWVDRARAGWSTVVAAPDSLDPATLERLRALGYLD